MPEFTELVRLVCVLAASDESASATELRCDACGDRFPSDYHLTRHRIMACTGYDPLRVAA